MFVNILIINICYHDNLHACKGTRRVIFFMLLAGAPSLRNFPYSINVLIWEDCRQLQCALLTIALSLYGHLDPRAKVFNKLKGIDRS